jgi:hypothetical protein
LAAEGTGLEAARAVRDLWLAPGLGVELSSPIFAELALHGRFSLLVPVVRPDYFVNGTEKIHEVPAVVLRFALGVAIPLL